MGSCSGVTMEQGTQYIVAKSGNRTRRAVYAFGLFRSFTSVSLILSRDHGGRVKNMWSISGNDSERDSLDQETPARDILQRPVNFGSFKV